jgi:transposase
MIDMLKRHEIQVLRRAGHSQQETAALAGVAIRSIRRVEAEAEVTHVDTAAERARRGVGRPSKAEPFRPQVVGWLTEDPTLLAVEILRRAKLAGYPGGKSALYELVQAVRPTPVRPVVRFEGLPGEFSQHDFGHVEVRWLDGTRQRVHFFASRLKYSRWVAVSLVSDERVETLVRTLVDHFQDFGGIPLLAVFDRPKTVALKWGRDGQVTEWNPVFAGVALDLGLGIELCWPHSPEQKGAVENLVGWVKGSFFKQRRFVDLEDVCTQLAAWLLEVNTMRPSRATGVIPAERLGEDRARLRPLKIAPTDLALRIPITVGPTGTVVHDTHTYSMPPEAIGIPGTLYLQRDRVRIVAGRFSAVHARVFTRGAPPSMLPEHRAEQVAAVSGKRAKRYLQREHLLALGPPVLAYLTELTHRRPAIWIHDIERLHALLQRHGEAAVRTAFVQALADQRIGAEYIAHYLEPAASPGILPFDPPSAPAPLAPRGGRVQVAAGARRGGAQRSTWTRLSTAPRSRADGGHR